MRCVTCQAELGATPRASIAVLVRGDEHLLAWFWCAHCKAYTADEYRDRFLGDSSARAWRVEAAEGDRLVALVSSCSQPQDKFCNCQAHHELGY